MKYENDRFAIRREPVAFWPKSQKHNRCYKRELLHRKKHQSLLSLRYSPGAALGLHLAFCYRSFAFEIKTSRDAFGKGSFSGGDSISTFPGGRGKAATISMALSEAWRQPISQRVLAG